jgi:acyl-CoA reductase-like NAD-dependent aldehyde dehydrogenase
VFADVTMDVRIGKEEIFGPILSILKWNDEGETLAQVNEVEYWLTCSIWTNDLVTAYRAAAAVEAGFVWITTCPSASSARRSAATSSPASDARKASRSSSAARARRTSTSI